jgi:RNA polymerase sigma-70 factor (ECF subfamily)
MSWDKTSYLQTLFLRYASEIEGFLSIRYPKETDLSDIVQETFLRLSQSSESEAIQNPKAYLFQTAVNITIDRYRWRESRCLVNNSEDELSALPSVQHTPEHQYQLQQQLQQFETLLDSLPLLQRHAFILYRIHDCSHAEIARRLGISVRCSQRYVMLSMQYLHEQLQRNTDLDWR